jgi:hypothetical protein
VIVGYGVTVPKGSLPVYSVDTEEQAKVLIATACGTNLNNEYVARELAEEQTIENLLAFGDRLAETARRLGIN